MQQLTINEPFILESGAELPTLEIAYHTYGSLNKRHDNVVWICHALTGNSNPAEWWDGLVGEGKVLDPQRYFIVCANMLGSCYGTTGPASLNPATGRPYGPDFPLVTVRDMVKAHRLLADHLGVGHIRLLIGGSMGGQQSVEWAIQEPGRFDKLAILAANARHSPWGIAFNEAQRMAIEADLAAGNGRMDIGKKGLEAARAIAMLSYRHYKTYHATQSEPSDEQLDNFRASSYQRYQGAKLWERFDVYSYITLSKAMDNHNVGRNRGGIARALGKIRAETLVVGISSDVLFPPEEQAELAGHIPGSHFVEIASIYGHDGFLVEYEQIAPLVDRLLVGGAFRAKKPPRPALSKQLFQRGLPGSETF